MKSGRSSHRFFSTSNYGWDMVLFRVTTLSNQTFKVSECESCLINRGFLNAAHSLAVLVLISDLLPIYCDGPGKHIRVQLTIFYATIMISKSPVRQSFSFAFTAFIPSHPPAFNILTFVNPNLSHGIDSIVILGVLIKRKRGPGGTGSSSKMETCEPAAKICRA